VDQNLHLIFFITFLLTVLSLLIIGLKDYVLDMKIENHEISPVKALYEVAGSGELFNVKTLIGKHRIYDSSYLIFSAMRESIKHEHVLAFSTLLDAAEQLGKANNLEELKSLLFASHTKKCWGISIILVRFICALTEKGIVEITNLFEDYSAQQKEIESLILFLGLPKKYRLIFVDKYFKTLMLFCLHNLDYKQEGIKIAQEREVHNLKEQIERDCYLGLLLSKCGNITPVNNVFQSYFSSSAPGIKANLFIIYYFYGMCLANYGLKADALYYFELVESLFPNYRNTRQLINELRSLKRQTATGFKYQQNTQNQQQYRENQSYKKEESKFKREQNTNPPKEVKKTCFSILNVPPTATVEEIKKAYRSKVVQYHPDKFASSGKAAEDKANEITKDLNRAYKECLKIIGAED
jgi:hypothetical protein